MNVSVNGFLGKNDTSMMQWQEGHVVRRIGKTVDYLPRRTPCRNRRVFGEQGQIGTTKILGMV